MPMTQKEAYNKFVGAEAIALMEGEKEVKLSMFGNLRILRNGHDSGTTLFWGGREIERRNAISIIQTYGEGSTR